MNKAVGAAIGIISLIIAFVFFPYVMRTAEEIKIKEVSEDHLATTAVAATEVVFALYNELYNANLSNIIDVSSSDSGDAPVATNYNKVTAELTVGGLVVDTTRTLQVEYHMDALEDDVVGGVSKFTNITPFLILGAIVAIGAGVVWHTFRGR